jgi:hypothetical protein
VHDVETDTGKTHTHQGCQQDVDPQQAGVEEYPYGVGAAQQGHQHQRLVVQFPVAGWAEIVLLEILVYARTQSGEKLGISPFKTYRLHNNGLSKGTTKGLNSGLVLE